MQAIPPDLFQAHNDTGRQLLMIAGLLVALDDLTADNEALNTPDPRAGAIFALIDALKSQMTKLSECHEAEWRAMSAGPLAEAAE